MTVPVAYDLSRLLLRSFSGGPNGIDRVDLNLARHFLADEAGDNYGVLLNKLRLFVVGQAGGQALLDMVDRSWRAEREPADDPVYRAVREAIVRPPGQAGRAAARIVGRSRSWAPTALRAASVLLPHLILPRPIPKNAVFFHATQFPSLQLFRWLDRRTDVKPVFFIHDLLPLHAPQFFTDQNAEEHRQFLEVFLRYGRAAVVNTEAVKQDVAALLRARSGADRPILVAPMPAEPLFAGPSLPDDELRAQPYFVICGTIEPRKNHRLLLDVWQELVRGEGAKAPKLVVIGSRGWNNKAVFDILDRAPWSATHIIEVAGLPSRSMKHIVANARASLMPSFAEGYGLPIVEAMAAGTPVIASDIAVFKEIGGAGITYCAPDDRASWRQAVQAQSDAAWRSPNTAMTAAENRAAWDQYVANITGFISGF